ncbi:cryptochrome/photolyase family protein [Sporosarcina obsidiansis]|uniref:cryptochrome/photolyase family protein n=1 Tax=Sporosarcina obsidiansis TaxID=2660748 RepID=UPI00129AAF8C|nr:deoxyribodipyrimidine photo-lyase [Sporosarcina obsidiansis]
MGKTIVWFRKDLRLHDHPALVEAAAHGEVLPVFILPEIRHEAADWWLHHSLLELQQKFGLQQVRLIIRRGDPVEQLRLIQKESGAQQIVFNELYDPVSRQQEQELTTAFEQIEVQVRSFQGIVLVPPNVIFNKSGQPYKVFTPFWKRLRQEPIGLPLPIPKDIPPTTVQLASLSVNEWGLIGETSWHEKFSKHWRPGETAAIELWEKFQDHGLSSYKEGRDIPAEPHVSRLSPYIANGNISVRSLWHNALLATEFIGNDQTEAFLRQLAWRDFAHYQLLYFPKMLTQPMRPEFESFPWQAVEEELHAWKNGKTGYPLVDAGMRELWETGYIHNRVRMIVASFLVKHLLVDWREGMAWFEQTLVDWDVANNAMGWQWVAGSGFDASPYFRIFNPTTQGEKFDEAAVYVKKWLPELRDIPEKYVFRPAEAPADVLEAAGVKIGDTYPSPIVDHQAARVRALAAYDTCKNLTDA